MAKANMTLDMVQSKLVTNEQEVSCIEPGPVPVNVWLIEDNYTFRDTVARVLARAGMECSHLFSNAEAALKAIVAGSVPDVILLDVELPGQSGIEALRKIKSLSPATRVVILTVFDNHDKIFEAICGGASGYLLKTSSMEEIVKSIREVLSGGAPLTPKVANSVLQMFGKLGKPQKDYGLTPREQKILELMTEGLIKKEIADRLSLSYHTIDFHLRNIYIKLHVHTSTGAVAKVLKEGIL